MMKDETTRFDEALRRQYRASLAQLSPRVHAQLAQRRHAAVSGAAPHRSRRLGYAVAGIAALCALAIGVQFRNPPSQPMPPPVAVAATNTTATAARAESTMLDQDPDFYAWLASPDAMQVAME